MTDAQTTPDPESAPRDDRVATEEWTTDEPYTIAELVFWIMGIASIPLVPILMIYFLTPQSGM